MDKRKKWFEELLKKNIKINTVLAMVLVVALFFFYLKPDSKIAVLVACFAGGFMNMLNGIPMWKDPVKRTTGMSYLLFGAVIIALGFIIIQYI
ncbi:MAG TPA: hypothetical protein GXX75_25115 [Clostridiales bacterium]|nr:hypothetical protein [Clostridiales bacterium]